MQPENSDGLKRLVEKVVCINRNGPESKKGLLATVKDDHLVLLTEEQYLYYQTNHVKSITFDSTEPLGAEAPFNKKLVYLDAVNFKGILEKMIFRRVQINQGGPESINGILSRLFEDHVDLVQGHEVIKIATPHIKNVSYTLSKQDANSNSNSNSNKDSQTKVVADDKTNDLSQQTELKEQTIVEETKPAEVEQKSQIRRRKRSEKRKMRLVQESKPITVEIPPDQESKPMIMEIPPVQELKPMIMEIPPVQESKPMIVEIPPVQESKPMIMEIPAVQESKLIDPVNIDPSQAPDSIKGDEFTDTLPVIANDQSQVTTEQIVVAPSQESSFIHNPVSNNSDLLFHLPVVEQTAKKAGRIRSRKSKLIKRKRKAIQPTVPQRKRQVIEPKLPRVLKTTKKIKKIKVAERIKVTKRTKVTKIVKATKGINVTKRWLLLSNKRQPLKAVVLGSVWLAPSIKKHFPR
ncbi:hypothetical protein [Paenibacillus radicis (ex Xue et al. 2023)]|uniref:DUF2642 domain-containing protein n=1 Tax=Paenibacillus radicis (ex Xue et al. 2023) TaxID=2972489 RepID=A0ABT1YCL4_9BACL|nr:hypothetical protein [Paenibacillus radicis (ex Xue et al. 2023)]MCR8630906.1 hypothetical protein [Paenibacillus radicis (ex Xue et al. 2023)]